MKLIFVFVLLTILACYPPINVESTNNLEKIEMELSGAHLGEKVNYLSKEIRNSSNDISIFVSHTKLKIEEIDIHLRKNSIERYNEIQKYYNTKFNKNKKDTLFSSWQTDSTEFILYKISDSSILVNIYKRK